MNMANMFGGADQTKKTQHLRFEEFVPSSSWKEDSDSFCLIIDLPGFKRDQVKLQVDNHGYLVASGERQVSEYKQIHFEQSYKMPENSNIEETTAKFEDEILYFVIKKKIKAVQGEKVPEENVKGREESESDSNGHSNEETSDDEDEECDDDEEEEEEEATEEEFHDAKMKKQWKLMMGFFITAIFAFSLGVFVFQPNEKLREL